MIINLAFIRLIIDMKFERTKEYIVIILSMKALILNSGTGSRMGVITSEHPKCMTEISIKNTILSRQLRMLTSFGVEEVVMTTGYYDKVLVDYCNALHLPLKYTFVNNPLYDKTNYIYSIYCAKDALKNDDIIDRKSTRLNSSHDT